MDSDLSYTHGFNNPMSLEDAVSRVFKLARKYVASEIGAARPVGSDIGGLVADLTALHHLEEATLEAVRVQQRAAADPDVPGDLADQAQQVVQLVQKTGS